MEDNKKTGLQSASFKKIPLTKKKTTSATLTTKSQSSANSGAKSYGSGSGRKLEEKNVSAQQAFTAD